MRDSQFVPFLVAAGFIGFLFLLHWISSYWRGKELELSGKKGTLDARAKELDRKEEELARRTELQEKLFEEKTKGFPWVAKQWALYRTKEFKHEEDLLMYKSRPACTAAEKVRKLRMKAEASERIAFMYKGIVGYYESLFPWLAEFRDEPEAFAPAMPEAPANDGTDPVRSRLTDEEWQSLDRQAKSQLALDRWWTRQKSPWEIGRDFERYVGWLYESNGWEVSYEGALKGLQDMGRDLIAKKSGWTVIVQCKRWAADKTIHERHVLQLFGSCVLYDLEHKLPPEKRSNGFLACTCGVSDTAKKCAEYLGIEVRENMIKWLTWQDKKPRLF